jgi:signal transduction histidine kinase/CheY-like chemotaxis protein
MHPNADFSHLMTGGMALAMAMGFVLNRHMRDHYRLQHRQMQLADEREAARAATYAVNAQRMALMETLQREVQTGLKGVENSLLQGLSHLTRAPAPRTYVDAALSEVAHLQSILTTTFDNDTAAAGRIEVACVPLDIARVCERMVAQFAALAQGKGLAFTLNTHGLPPRGAALGDEHRVEQVLAHLLSNALLYTQQGRVELKLVMPSADTLRLEVVDSGPGLDDEELALAFTPHMRIQRTSSGHSGAGLGLSLSRSLAELMNGQLGAQSTLDVGSKFWLDLPFEAHAVPPPRPVATPDDIAAPTHSLRVLLLSNDSLRAAQLRDQLEHLGHKCLTSTSRERALALARKAPVDACLISTGAFEDLREDGNRERVQAFLTSLRATQHEANLAILALLPEGDQIEDLQALGVKPLLLPQNRDSLGRALAAG